MTEDDAKYQRVSSDEESKALDDAMDLVNIELRLDKDLLKDLKNIAVEYDIYWKAFIREILQDKVERFKSFNHNLNL